MHPEIRDYVSKKPAELVMKAFHEIKARIGQLKESPDEAAEAVRMYGMDDFSDMQNIQNLTEGDREIFMSNVRNTIEGYPVKFRDGIYRVLVARGQYSE